MTIDFKKFPSITVAELKRELAKLPDDWTIDFCGLEFHRCKPRGETHAQMEFNQVIDRDRQGNLFIALQ